MKKELKLFVTLALLITLILISANDIFADQGKVPNTIEILGGTVGGDWFQMGAVISEMFRKEGVKSNVEVGGGNSNVVLINKQEADLGFTMGVSVTLARKGELPFTEKLNDVMLVALLDVKYIYIMVTEESGITKIEELKGKSFASQTEMSTTQLAFADILQAYGLNEDDLILGRGGITEAKNMVKDRHAVGLIGVNATPNHVNEVDIFIPLKALSISDEAFERLKKINEAYDRITINWKGEEVPTANTHTFLVTNRNMPEDEIYWMTKTIVENLQDLRDSSAALKDLDPQIMSKELGIELHPGARKYYEEIGITFD